MSINLMEVYMKCPVCEEITTKHDYHENTSSDRFEYFLVLNGKNQCFVCPFCKNETSYDHIFTEGYCKVEDLEKYKVLLRRRLCDSNMIFSEWDPGMGEEPALSRLILMYPEDSELKRIKETYRAFHAVGKRAVTRLETYEETVSRDMIRVPEALERVYLGNNVRVISSNTFENCKALEDIYIPDSVTEIGDYAFAKSNLSKVHVSKGIVNIGKRAFYHTRISKIFFPDNIRIIGEECFMDCPYLNNVWIPSSVIVGHNAFAQCSNLKHIQIAESVSQETVNTWGLSENCVIEKYKIFKQR